MANKLGEHIRRVLASGGFVSFSPEELDLRRRAVADLRAGVTPGALMKGFLDAFVPPDERDAETERIIMLVEKQSAPRFIRALARIFEIGTGANALKPYATPTTVLHARRDAMVPLPHGEQLAALGSNAKLVVFDAGSHMLPLSHAEQFAHHLFGVA